MERWKYYLDTYYEVSDLGNVRSNYKGVQKLMTLQKHKKGYLRVTLSGHQKKFIHRLVAEVWLPKIDGKTHVNHKNFNKENNCVSNLEWCDIHENNSHAQKGGIGSVAKECLVFGIDGNLIKEYPSRTKAYYSMRAILKPKEFVIIPKLDYSDELKIELINKKTQPQVKNKRKVLENRFLNEDAVRFIRKVAEDKEFIPSRIARMFNVDRATVAGILSGKNYRDIL